MDLSNGKKIPKSLLHCFYKFRWFQARKKHYDYPARFLQQILRHFLVIPLSTQYFVAEIQCNFCNTTYSSINGFEVAENPSWPQINRNSSQPLSWASLNWSSSNHLPSNLIMSLSTRLKISLSLSYQKTVLLWRYASAAINHLLIFSLCLSRPTCLFHHKAGLPDLRTSCLSFVVPS